MCGIAGIISREAGGVDETTIRRMCGTIAHRGPDDEGVFVKEGVGLGMRRLSIIDLAGGHQPVFNEDGSVCLVFNGEIYNFSELRAELEKRGHRFYTRTDTEVIVHLYEDLGAECVHRLRGMFAFALYDGRHARLLLARDRLGIKPLHYAMTDGRLLFGSEIKAILAAAPELSDPDPKALFEYFSYGYIPDPATAFKLILKLPPGHLLEFAGGEVRVRPYWDLPQYGAVKAWREDECLDELEARLAEAVRIRLIADVPLGALLSGGIDSSTVVALMARASGTPVRTFTIGFQRDDFNEAPYARKVAERFGTDHHELILDPDVVNTVNELSRSLEEPFGDSSMLPTYYISCLARRHVTVALSGDGGDELFAGYDRYHTYLRPAYDRIPGWAGRFYREQVHRRLPRSVPGRNRLYNLALPWPERYLEAVSFLPAFERDVPLLTRDFRHHALSGEDGDVKDAMRSVLARAPAHDALSAALYLDTKTYLPGDILTKVDRMSMATSLEVRVPLLDHVFVEWVTGLPVEFKHRAGKAKYLLRKVAERLGVPPAVLNRPKQGFALPLTHWIRRESRDFLQTVLLEPRTLQRGYLDARGVRRMLEEHLSGRRSHWSRLWRLLMFELWHRNFLEACTAPPVLSLAADRSVRPGVVRPGAG